MTALEASPKVVTALMEELAGPGLQVRQGGQDVCLFILPRGRDQPFLGITGVQFY